MCSRFRCRLKSRPARSCRRWVLSMTSARSGSRKRWSLPSAGPRVRGTPSPRGPDRAVNILSPGSARNASSPGLAFSCDRLTPDTLIRDGDSRLFRTADRFVTGGTWPSLLTAPVLGHLILTVENIKLARAKTARCPRRRIKRLRSITTCNIYYSSRDFY